jgi:Ca2+-binding EF-hand superfamily protein
MFHLEYQTDLQDAFDTFDFDKDGKISPNDLKKAIKNNGYDKVTNDKLNQMVIFMMNEIDIDEDGLISFHEFVTIMESV